MGVFRSCWNFADGGLGMFDALSGSPVNGSTSPTPPNASRRMEVVANSWIKLRTSSFAGGRDKSTNTGSLGTYQKVLGKYYFPDITPTAAIDFFRMHAENGASLSDSDTQIVLRLRTDGDVEVRGNENATVVSTITAPFIANTWYDISVTFEVLNSGQSRVWINKTTDPLANATIQSDSAADYLQSTGGTLGQFYAYNPSGTGTSFYVTELAFYQLTDFADGANFPDRLSVYDYRCGGSPTTVGSALDTGSWANAGEQPVNETNVAQYDTDPGPPGLHGFAKFDSTGGGPASASGGAPAGTFRGGNYWFWDKRSNGGSTVQEISVGNSNDTTSTITRRENFTLSSYTFDWVATDPVTESIMPDNTEDAAMGMLNDGARDFTIADMYFMLAVEPDEGFDHPPLFGRRSFMPHLAR